MHLHAMAPKKYKRSVISGMIHRIYRSCSTWQNIHESINKAKKILSQNQYPKDFYEPIIHQALTKLVLPPVSNEPEEEEPSEEEAENNEVENPDISSNGSESGEEVTKIDDRDKYHLFKFFVQYRGKAIEHFVRSLHNYKAPMHGGDNTTETKNCHALTLT